MLLTSCSQPLTVRWRCLLRVEAQSAHFFRCAFRIELNFKSAGGPCIVVRVGQSNAHPGKEVCAYTLS